MPEINLPPDPLNAMADAVFAIANARLKGEITHAEWQILIDELCPKGK